MSLVPLHQDLLASASGDEALRTWLTQCPNPEAMSLIVEKFMWLSKKVGCGLCGRAYPRKELRYDEASTSNCDPTSLICRNCWDSFNNGTVGNPSYRPPKWPESPPEPHVSPVPLIPYGVLMPLRGAPIGLVAQYNPRRHYGYVTLFRLENYAEYGSLDPSIQVMEISREQFISQGGQERPEEEEEDD